jgi:hypothetical protein
MARPEIRRQMQLVDSGGESPTGLWPCGREKGEGWDAGGWSPPGCFLRGAHDDAPGWTLMGWVRHGVVGHIFWHEPMLTPIRGHPV